MNNNIILKALQSQLETVKAAAIAHEQDVYQPAVAKLTAKLKAWFEENVMADLHDIELQSENIVIYPSDTTAYGNTITIQYRSSWRGDNAYFETSAYRPDLDSREDNGVTIFYYTTMARVAVKFADICEQWKTKWMPAFGKLEAAKSAAYSSIYGIESEIRKIETEIANDEKAVYNKAGFECTLKPYANYKSDYSGDKAIYVKESNAHSIRAFYGRGRWDYNAINSFKVVSFPKAKHAKVVLEWKMSSDDKVRTAELNKQRYADFVNEVYNWQTTGADQREALIDERIISWNK